jgi:hypothetical protein
VLPEANRAQKLQLIIELFCSDYQGAVISVLKTLFLIAMTDICKEMEEQTKMIGYTDDWITYTSHKLPREAEARLKAADKVIQWTNENEYQPRKQNLCSSTEETET